MATAAENGMSAVALKVLESGALTGAVQPHPTSSLARRPNQEFSNNAHRTRALQFLVRDGQTLTQAAVRFVLGDPRVSVVLVGFSALDQIAEAASAADGQRLSADDLARIEALYATDFVASLVS
jgi:aryl-alcohol dehydrogenase-like predicted oxidoreductase